MHPLHSQSLSRPQIEASLPRVGTRLTSHHAREGHVRPRQLRANNEPSAPEKSRHNARTGVTMVTRGFKSTESGQHFASVFCTYFRYMHREFLNNSDRHSKSSNPDINFCRSDNRNNLGQDANNLNKTFVKKDIPLTNKLDETIKHPYSFFISGHATNTLFLKHRRPLDKSPDLTVTLKSSQHPPFWKTFASVVHPL